MGVSIANCIISAALLAVTAISAFYAFKAYNHQKQRSKMEAACSLAQHYAHNILEKYSILLNILRNSGLEAMTKELFPYEALSKFDTAELSSLLSNSNSQESIESLAEKYNRIDPVCIYSAKIKYAKGISERRLLASEYIIPRDAENKVKIAHSDLLIDEFHIMISDLLNDLEWFAMNCQHGLADEKLLYQSLHQTFLSQAWNFYYYIASKNTNNEDKFFTNLISLFDQWKDRLFDIKNQTTIQREQIEKNILRQKERLNCIDAPIYSGDVLK